MSGKGSVPDDMGCRDPSDDRPALALAKDQDRTVGIADAVLAADPSSMPVNSPWPWLPTTTRSAPRDASTSAGAGWPWRTIGRMTVPG
jgi:hypothetical protein